LKNKAFHAFITRWAELKGMTIETFCTFLGRSKSLMYRKLRSFPWERVGGHDGQIAYTMAQWLPDNFGKILWLMGYNPFIAEDLTLEEMEFLHEFNMRLVGYLKSGALASVSRMGDLRALLGVSLDGLRRQSYERSKARNEDANLQNENMESNVGNGK